VRKILISLVPAALLAQTPEGIAYFEKNIRPLLAANCYGCHSAKLDKPMAGLLLDSRAGTLRVIMPGKPDDSLLLTAVRGTRPNLKMPPGKKLSDAEITALARWIQTGAPDPRTDAAAPAVSQIDWEKAKQHWSFRPVADPKPPRSTSPEWTSPIDAFIKARLDEQELTPAPRAPKIALLRRVTYDLTGLPPSPDEIDAFLKDASAKSYEKVVDRLLASPRYGERWGRHWLDVVRYADTSGDNSDFPVPAMFRYRNWVIAAFNKDQPYDQFLRDQIAGDIIAAREGLAEKNREEWQQKTIATGYLANSRRFGSRILEFHLTIDDTIDNLGKGMLGMTVACARCHDHKYDPIPNADYYALYGIFKSTAYPHAGTEIYPHTFGFAALDPAKAGELKRNEDQLSGLDNRIEDIKAGKIKFPSDDEKRKAETENQANLRRFSNQYPYLQKAYAVSEGKPANAKIMVRGEPASLGPEAPRGFLTVLGGQKLPADEQGSGRLELAQWITDPKNPLTARVIVNRVWGWHFGRGIVATPDDFGARGEPPSHPELLDYLASRFVENGWSIKKLTRMIVLSRAYQAASTYDAKSALADPNNKYLWRFGRRRLDAEEIRDGFLAVSGNLDPTPGGEFPFAPEMTWKYTQHQPFIGKEQDFATNKRSVYLMQQRIRRQPFLDLFDGPDPNGVTGVRPVTTTALQALYTMNDPFFHAQADALAVRVGMAYGSDLERLTYAYRLLYARTPTLEEVRDCRQFLSQARGSLGGTPVPDDRKNREALASLMRVLMSANEFVTLD
jgi:cytochrome c553